jgi:hypothetical protein
MSHSPMNLKTNDRTFVVIGQCLAGTVGRHHWLSAGFDLWLPRGE